MTSGKGFEWIEKSLEAFETLKNAMVTLPVLALPDFACIFVVESNASRIGVGVILSQNQRSLAFFSKTLSA